MPLQNNYASPSQKMCLRAICEQQRSTLANELPDLRRGLIFAIIDLADSV